MMVLDTDVFIDHFRGLEAATTYIQSLPADQRATTDITVMELYKGATNREELTTIERFLTRNRVTRLPVVVAASQRAVQLVHQHGLAHGPSDPRCADCRDCPGGRMHPRDEQCAPLSVHRGLASAAGAIPSSAARLRQVGCQNCRGLLLTALAFSIISLHEPLAFPSRLSQGHSPSLFILKTHAFGNNGLSDCYLGDACAASSRQRKSA